MATIIPFRGYRYDPAVVGSISDVVTPPYDRVYPDVQQACYQRSPYNIVRIIKGLSQAADSDGNNVYTRAADSLREWIAKRVLIRDSEPAFYAYHQTYSFEGEHLTRKGVIALGKLEPEKVHAHENTLKGPKADRLKLMQATEANFGHIFMLYNDPTRSTEKALRAVVESNAPLIEATDADGNLHQVWRITDANIIATIQAALDDKDLYIADGHHRYETAVNFMHECQENGWQAAAPESFDVRMMTLFNVADPGMSIRPIHRLIHGIEGFEADDFFAAAARDFHIEKHATVDAMMTATRDGRRQHMIGCVVGDSNVTFTLKDVTMMEALIGPDRSEDYKRLDVTILHAAILDRLLGIDVKALEEQRNVTYTVDADEGVAMVKTGKEQLFFYLNATSPEEVVRVADHNEKMPQKSTDFYPKLLTGLVLAKMEIKK
ncbi:DUF1015 domain-containing protein [Candidatus Bipolaricaulota bacterium]|nr:DUF1015 domain-containing protein [Candidatus Bipolaricaulota bacterium]